MPKIKDIRFYITDVDALKDSFGTIAHYARKRNLNYKVTMVVVHNNGRSRHVEKQLERDGFLKYINTPNEEVFRCN